MATPVKEMVRMRTGKKPDFGPKVSWQAAVAICALVVIGGSTWITADLAQSPDQRGSDDWLRIYRICSILMFAVFGLAVWSRLRRIRLSARRWQVFNQLGLGMAVTVGAVILTSVASRSPLHFFGEHWYVVPLGAYVLAALIIIDAMNPDEDP